MLGSESLAGRRRCLRRLCRQRAEGARWRRCVQWWQQAQQVVVGEKGSAGRHSMPQRKFLSAGVTWHGSVRSGGVLQ